MSDTLYIKFDKNAAVTTPSVTLGDVGKFECTNKDIVNKIKTIKILTFTDKNHTRYVFSALKAIELIHKEYPSLQISNLGEVDFVIESKHVRKNNKPWQFIKTAFISLTLFFGAAFAIMTFNNDVSAPDIFQNIYEQMTGGKSNGFTIIEITYSIGLAAGILIFYNHFGSKKITKDPTPIEVEMRLYEDDINKTLIEGVNRKESHIDVD